jgi:methanogenic corrinoid protein MtbC1
MSKKLVSAIADMREEEALKLVRKMVAEGATPTAILDAAREAMGIVGERYEKAVTSCRAITTGGCWPRSRNHQARAGDTADPTSTRC